MAREIHPILNFFTTQQIRDRRRTSETCSRHVVGRVALGAAGVALPWKRQQAEKPRGALDKSYSANSTKGRLLHTCNAGRAGVLPLHTHGTGWSARG
jgi:hypothetical protein